MKAFKKLSSILLASVMGITVYGQRISPEPVRGGHVSEVKKSDHQRYIEMGFNTFSLYSPAGVTLLALKHQIEKLTEQNINIIIPEGVKDYPLPEFSVESITVPELFNSLSMADSGIKLQAESQPPTPESIWVIHIRNQSSEMGGLSGAGARRGDLSEKSPTVVKKFIGHLMDHFSIEDIATALELSWKMNEIPNNVELEYHAETQILFLKGTVAHYRLLEEVLAQVEQASIFKRGQEEKGAKDHLALQELLDKIAFLENSKARVEELLHQKNAELLGIERHFNLERQAIRESLEDQYKKKMQELMDAQREEMLKVEVERTRMELMLENLHKQLPRPSSGNEK